MQVTGGVLAPLVNPCREDDSLDFPALEAQLSRLLDSRVDGIYLNGGTGDAANLTQEERLRAVVAHLERGQSIPEVAKAYGLPAQLVHSWVKKYRAQGFAGLEDRCGKRLSKQTPRDKEEALRIENARLQEENELLRLELYLRKKLETLGRGDV